MRRPDTRRPNGRGARRTLRTYVRINVGRTRTDPATAAGGGSSTTLPPRRAGSAWWTASGRGCRATGRGGAGEFRRGRVVAARDGNLHWGCPDCDGEGCRLPNRE